MKEDRQPLNEETRKQPEEQQYSLNDDRRVKVLSPGLLVYKRFIRNRVAVTGLIILIFMGYYFRRKEIPCSYVPRNPTRFPLHPAFSPDC